MQDFSAFFPVEVITQMLGGVPEEYRQKKVREWVDTSLHREPGQIDMSEEGMQAIAESMGGLYYSLIQERRAEPPRDDMFSRLVAAEIEREDGEMESLDDFEIAGFATLLGGGAGAETVTKLVGNAAVTFARFPDQWQKLLEDRSKIPAAVEELLRYEPPVHYNVRRSMREVQLHGVTIPPEGKPVFLLGGSAHRDPEAFTDPPDAFDIDRDRTEAQNLGFGYGVHSCSGRRWPGWRPRSRWTDCSTPCRATRCSGTNASGWRCRTSRAGPTSRCG